LVILDGQLDAGTPLPASLNVRIPAAAGQPHAVAVRTPAGDLLTAEFTTAPAGDDIMVRLTTDQLAFRIEYYDPAITRAGEQRALSFRWTSDYPVSAAAVRVQQPAGASGLTGNPALVSLGAGADGLSYFEHSYGPVLAGGAVSLEVSYSKASDTLSAEVLGATLPVEDGETALSYQNLPWLTGAIVAGVGLVAIGGAAYVLRRRRQSLNRHRRGAAHRHASAASAAPSARRRKGRRPPAQGQAQQQAFCTRCGERLEPSDQFCRKCGEPRMARP
jgi:hypothetical protein